jgi:hypothetical protein
MNHFQFIGTHNSYHLAPSAKVRQMVDAFADGQGQALDYSHRPIREQLDVLGVRQIELDIYGDPKGGIYASPLADRITRQTPREPDAAWKAPGFKIFHSPDFDQNTNVISLRLALRDLRQWSNEHPEHEPVLVLLELEEDSYTALKPPPFDRDALLALEAEIREEMPATQVLTPDNVRGASPTLRDAVTKNGWPNLSKVRGKFLFAIDNENAVRDTYLDLSPKKDLDNRLCFVSVAADHPAAAWMKRNDPIQSYQEIRELVATGFVVRTRADAELKEVLANDRSRFEAAVSSGAQWISTDAPEPDPRQPNYQVSWPNHVPWSLNQFFVKAKN